jgi:hypothetical protein
MGNSIADACPQSTASLVPTHCPLHPVNAPKPRVVSPIHFVQTMIFALAIAGSLIPGITVSPIPGRPTIVGSAVTTMTASAGPGSALSFRPLGNCPGGGIPCP